MRRIIVIIICLGAGFASGVHAGFWRTLCEKYLVADDPYQFEHLTIDQLIYAYWNGWRSRALVREMRRRLRDESISRDDREVLEKNLANEQTPPRH